MTNIKHSWLTFLWDVLVTSLTAFGGPEAHYGVFRKRLIDLKGYVKQEQLNEWIGVYSLIPGPTSTQTMMAIGYSVGGPVLAFLTFIVWAIPAMTFLIILGLLYPVLTANAFILTGLRYLPIFGVALLGYAAIRFFQHVIKKQDQFILYGFVLALAYFFGPIGFWVFPLILIFSGVYYSAKHHLSWVKSLTLPPLRLNGFLFGFILFTVVATEYLVTQLSASEWLTMLTFYRFGYSIIGGGQLVLPFMIEQLVNIQESLTLNALFSGYTFDQLIPGPLFSFASFVGVLMHPDEGLNTILIGYASGFSLFLPGILLVYLIYPVWEKMKQYPIFLFFIQGVTVAAAALIGLTAIVQAVRMPLSLDIWLIFSVSLFLLWKKKTNIFVLIALTIGLGFLFN